MFVKCIKDVTVVLIFIFVSVNALEFKENGYQDLVISISPDVVEGADGQIVVDNIKV